MVKRRNRKHPHKPNNKTTKHGGLLLEGANKNKQKIIHYAKQNKKESFYKWLNYLVSNQSNTPKLLAKSLCDIANQISNESLKTDLLEKAYQCNRVDSVTLTSYASALANAGNTEHAFELFQQSLDISQTDTVTLNSYASALASAGNTEHAFELFEQSLQVNNTDSITLLLFARLLQVTGENDKAFHYFKQIDLNKVFTGVANLVRFNLIHLAFKLKKPVEGHQYLDALLKNSPNEDKARLEAAATIMETDPYSAEANQQLQLIAQNSPLYQQALKMLSTSLGSSEFFEEFKSVQPANDIDPHEIQNINRAIYHKIKNEIAIFSEIIYGFLEDYPASTSFLTGLVAKIQQLNQKINEYRQEEKQQLDKVTQSEYQHIISIISKTAHDLVDFVGNEMAIFRETVQLELEEESEHHALYSDIFKQIQLTEVALSDLKSVNEGIKISTTQFKLTELISRWKETLTFAHADIDTFIYDENVLFNSDLAKIKSFINELVDNSIKHNPQHPELSIYIKIRKTTHLPSLKNKKHNFSQKNYLKISVSDNGVGIPDDKKEWIFLPLHTTAKNNTGSGLGLFMIRRTLKEMQGIITETGKKGAHFEIYIPFKE